MMYLLVLLSFFSFPYKQQKTEAFSEPYLALLRGTRAGKQFLMHYSLILEVTLFNQGWSFPTCLTHIVPNLKRAVS